MLNSTLLVYDPKNINLTLAFRKENLLDKL